MADKVAKAPKIKKKKWYTVQAAEFFGNAALGESFVAEREQLSGKSLKINLSTLSGDLRQQNITLSFRINKIADEKAIADLTGYQMAAPTIKRIVGRKGDRVDANFTCETKDGAHVIIKPILLTANAAHGSVQRTIRKAVALAMQEEAKTVTYNEFVQSIIAHNLQSGLKKKLSKLYPLKALEIKAFSLRQAPAEKVIKQAAKKKEA